MAEETPQVNVNVREARPQRAAGRQGRAAGGLSSREKLLAVLLVVAVIAAIAGFVLFAKAGTAATGAAAKVDDFYIAEEDVAVWISQYRASYSMSDDATFVSSLLSSDMSVSDLRKEAIDQLALSQLILQRAEELGVTPTDEECQEQLDAIKESMSLGDEETWQETLETYNLTEEGLLEQYRVNLAEDAICEQDVDHRDATDDELLSYLQSYLAGTTQYHAYRIMFTGDDAADDAEEVYAMLQEMQEDGELDTASFSTMALQYSAEETVAETGGSYAWSGSEMADEVKEAMEYATVGELIGIETVAEDDDAVEIIYCDTSYTFAESDELTELPDDVPDALLAEVQDAAADEVFETNCDDYLNWLLAQASITYYPVPEDAEYNLDLNATYDDESEDAETDEDAESTEDAEDTEDDSGADDTEEDADAVEEEGSE